MVVHPIEPLYGRNSEILILGSFPSVKSREQEFFYAHPQNRFWRVMASICDSPIPETVNEKTDMILNNGFALWDVIHSCDITGSSDSSIKNVVPNNINIILDNAEIKKIFVNGKKAESLYKKYIEKTVGIKAVVLPSSSPANALWTLDRLTAEWKRLINFG